jgi:hypothetical protein
MAVAAFVPPIPAFAEKKATAFAQIGERYHNSDYIRTALGKTFVDELEISIDFRNEVKLLNAEELKGDKPLLILRNGMLWPGGHLQTQPRVGPDRVASTPPLISEPPLPKSDAEPFLWITLEQGTAVKEFVSKGGTALFYHNVTYISPHNDGLREGRGQH